VSDGNRLISLTLCLVLGLLEVLTPAGQLHAQVSRGVLHGTVVDQVLGHWQSIQDRLRTEIAPLGEPDFDFELLFDSPFASPVDVLDPATLSALTPRLVIVLGGLQGRRRSAKRFAMAMHQSCKIDKQYAVFVYPNDGSIQSSGEVLFKLLQHIQDCAPRTRITLIAHSMGGLVARQCLESCACATGKSRLPSVDQLVMICPPNHGSVLAQYADALEFTDAITKMKSGDQSIPVVLRSLINDGLGEACEELVPNSEFLQQLNSKPRAVGVQYTIIAGTGGLITPLVRLAAATVVDESFSRTRISRLSNASDLVLRANELLTSDEFARGCGDGVVSLKSAQLPGVHEFSELDIFHSEWADTEKPQVQLLVKKVAESLDRK
jgi:pimeloyl-ACP methyl ester carboxylesterase